MAALAMCSLPAAGQAPPYPPPYPAPQAYPPAELDRLVAPIALYPDPLLAQVLAAATFPDQLPDAARWADEHHYLTGDALAAAIAQDQLPWDPSVEALLPFPSVLDRLASDMGWTQALGNAFLSQQPEVMDAVQRMRHQAWDYGYLRTNAEVVVTGGPYIEILPVNPALMCVPYYDPVVVFARPRPGFMVAGAIRFGFVVPIGPAYRPWGWGGNRFVWNSHSVIVNNNRWNRTWVNRNTYAHPYTTPRYQAPRPVERHEVQPRSPQERQAARTGQQRVEQHHAKEERQRDERR